LTDWETLRILHTVSRYRRYVEGTRLPADTDGGDAPASHPPRTTLGERALRRLARGVLAHRVAVLVVSGLFVVVAAVLGGNVSSSGGYSSRAP
jgi:hypothetical protein